MMLDLHALTWLHQLQEWQGLLGSLIGFGGVIVTLSVNAWLQRRAETERVRKEAQAVTTSLAATFARASAIIEDWTPQKPTNPFLASAPIISLVRDRLLVLKPVELIIALEALAFYEDALGNMGDFVIAWRESQDHLSEAKKILSTFGIIDESTDQRVQKESINVAEWHSEEVELETELSDFSKITAMKLSGFAVQLDPMWRDAPTSSFASAAIREKQQSQS